MPRQVLMESFLALLAVSPLAAQARFTDPPHLVPRAMAVGAANPTNGDLWLIGGRADRVLDLWRLRAGSWQKQSDGPFLGTADAMAFDPNRQRLVAALRRESSERHLCEFDGTAWTIGPSLGYVESQLAWDPVRQVTLVFSQTTSTSFGYLQAWGGSNLLPLFTFNVQYGLFGFDTSRGKAVVAAYDRVYEWDGSWSQTLVQRPSLAAARWFTDPWNGRFVLASTDYGATATSAHAWTGAQWVDWPTHGIPARTWATLVGNPQRQRVQLVGGSDTYAHGDAFESNGTTWTQVTPDTAAPVFQDPEMAAVGNGQALLFDGGGGLGQRQTARLQNGTWTVLQPAVSPSARSGFALAGDPATGRAWLFGGTVGSAENGEFWQWDGTNWVAMPNGPPARTGAAMCHDPLADSVLLYGGIGRSDTWEFRNGVWQQRSANFPPHTRTCRLAHDGQRRRTVLVTFGLAGVEVWELDGGRNWFSTNPPTRPVLTDRFHATYESLRQRIVVVDRGPGLGNVPRGEAFEWDGATWRSFGPESRLSLATAVAGVPGIGVVAHNGIDRFGTVLTHDWPAVVTSFGSTCTVPSWALTATTPWLGRTLSLRMPVPVSRVGVFATGFSNTQTGTTPLPLSLAGFGYPACQLHVDPLFVQARPWANGAATLDVPLPVDPAFAGLDLHHQAFVIESPPQPFVASNGLTTRLGSLW